MQPYAFFYKCKIIIMHSYRCVNILVNKKQADFVTAVKDH